MNASATFGMVLFGFAVIGFVVVLKRVWQTVKRTFQVIAAIARSTAEKLATPQAIASSEASHNPRNAEPTEAQIRAYLARMTAAATPTTTTTTTTKDGAN